MLRIERLTKNYGQTVGLSSAEFTVNRGEVTGLIGPNGSGKTTLLRMIAGVTPPSSGEIFLFDKPIKNNLPMLKREVGFLTNEMKLYPKLTPKEILQYFGALFDIPKSIVRDRITYLSDKFNLSSFMNRYCETLSTGQAQRVALSRVLIHNPSLIILDEPTTGLDIFNKNTLLSYIKDLSQKESKAIIFSTHNFDEIDFISNKIIVLSNNKMIFHGNKRDLLDLSMAENINDAFFNLV